MKSTITVAIIFFLLKANAQQKNVLDIYPLYQHAPAWCWVSQVPSGSAVTLQNMLRDYPTVARNVCGSGHSISSTLVNSRISRNHIFQEIDDGGLLL